MSGGGMLKTWWRHVCHYLLEWTFFKKRKISLFRPTFKCCIIGSHMWLLWFSQSEPMKQHLKVGRKSTVLPFLKKVRSSKVKLNLIIYWNNYPPLGTCSLWGYSQVWGTVGSCLTPRARKHRWHFGFPALMAVGATDRFLEDLSKDDSRDWFLSKVVETKVVWDV